MPVSRLTPQSQNLFTAANQVNGNGYDAAGNQATYSPDTLTYDAKNQLVKVTDHSPSGGWVQYYYDANGQRVLKGFSDGNSRVYAYDAFGQVAAEYSTLAQPPAPVCGPCYLTADQLGSLRLITDASFNVVGRHDFLPFGEEVPASITGRDMHFGQDGAVNQKFTGKERGSETSLDYFGARYYGSALGRNDGPDPHTGTMLHVINPQRWNMYAYAMNNPLSYVDPDGRDAIAVGFKTLAAGAGDAALISVHRDGSVRFGSYGPRGGGKPVWPGQYVVLPLKTKLIRQRWCAACGLSGSSRWGSCGS